MSIENLRIAELLPSGPVLLAGARSGLPWRGTRQPGEDLADLPEPLREQIEAHWAEPLGEGEEAETRAERWARERSEAEAEPERSLEEIRAEALARIDAEAERERARYLTPGSGQALEYNATAAEAAAIQDDPDPQPAAYPMLEAERQALAAVGVSASLQDVAAQVLAEESGWRSIGAAIKTVRRAAKLQAGAAEDAETIAALFPLPWPEA